MHINALELLAVDFALQQLGHHMTNSTVRLLMDNMTAAAYIRKQGGTHSLTLNNLALRVLSLASSLKIVLIPVYIKSSHNVAADSLSRRGQVLETEWCLNRTILQRVFNRLGHPVIDLFATPENRVVGPFYSPYPSADALAMDALSADWDNKGLLYAFPPFKTVPEVIKKFKRTVGCNLILIAPHNSTYSWTPELLQLAQRHYMLPQCHDLLFQEVGGVTHFHKLLSALRLTAWLL